MKCKVGKWYITVTPKPHKFIPSGLRVFLTEEQEANCYPIMYTDLIQGKQRYYYKKAIKPTTKVVGAEIFGIYENNL